MTRLRAALWPFVLGHACVAVWAAGAPAAQAQDPAALERARGGRSGAAHCDWRAPGPSVPPAVLRTALQRLPPQPPGAARGYDAELAALARVVPGGFAGYFVDPPAGDAARGGPPWPTVVRLVRPTERAAALAALAPALARYHGGTADVANARGLPARWDYAQLYDWQRYLAARLGPGAGLTLAGIDEVANAVTLGVATADARRALLARLSAVGAPCGLVHVVVSRPARAPQHRGPRAGR